LIDKPQSALEPADERAHGTVVPTPPIDLDFVVGEASSAAGGMAAVASSFRHALRAAGPLRTAQTFLSVNQLNGFDCPSCAWADPEEHRSMVEFCENGAKAIADAATTRRIGAEFFATHSVGDLSGASDQWLNDAGRLVEPLVLAPGAAHYEPIAWSAAFELIADELRTLADPNEAAFYTSGKASNEAAFLYQLFARMFGTNNLPDCSNLCHESSGAAIKASLGVGKATVTQHDLEQAGCILVVGQNPGTNHPRMLTSLQTAKRRGATIIAINPLPEVGLMRFKHPQDVAGLLGPGTALCDHFLQVRINGDAALFKGILKAFFAREAAAPGAAFDEQFIREHTSGFAEFAASIATVDWAVIEAQSGIGRERIEQIAAIIAGSRSVVACWAMGLTQHKNGVAAIRELINVLLAGGNIGRPGAGVLPVRGHSNVQGDRTMGIFERIDDAFLDRLGAEFGFEPPRAHGYDVVKTVRAMADGRIGVFVSLGGNFLGATPDTELVARALRSTKLSVCISTKLNRGHLVTGRTALILPCLTRLERDVQESGEQFVTVENTVSIVSRSRGRLEPASIALKSEPAIVAGIAAATLRGRHALDWEPFVRDYDLIRDRIARIVPGFGAFNARIRSDEPFYAPVPAKARVFDTPTRKAQWSIAPLPEEDLAPGHYVMMTIRTHDQFNTVIYGPDDRYRGIFGGRRVILMNREDMEHAGLSERQLVDITSHFNGQQRVVRRFAVVPYDIPRRSTATYYPETNPLVPLESTAEISNTPTSKYVVITLTPSAAA
jgi:molybdopterin-dependent oxidoreductase alpha subunit